jgi:hypothetical protein
VGGELANRMATLWAPVLEVVAADRDIQETRAAYERLLAQVPMPDDIQVRPVLAGGVSSLEVSAGSELDALGRAPEELAADQPLEAADLPAQRGLGQEQPLGGAAEVQLLRDGDERA